TNVCGPEYLIYQRAVLSRIFQPRLRHSSQSNSYFLARLIIPNRSNLQGLMQTTLRLLNRRRSSADNCRVHLQPQPPGYEHTCLYLALGPTDCATVPDSEKYFYSYMCEVPDRGVTLATVGPLSPFFAQLRRRTDPRRYLSSIRLAKKFIRRCGRRLFRQAGRESPLPTPLDALAAACPAFGAALRDVLDAAGQRTARDGGDPRRLHSVYLVDGNLLRARVTDRLGLAGLDC
ncbi:hypothetical protein BOX15_Mlig011873g3, partial [Macrostomum lignano]